MTPIQTSSFCPTCYREISAAIEVEADGAWMTKECPAHGSTRALVERDPNFFTYVRSLENQSIYGGYFVDVTRRCNLRCEWCYVALQDKDPEGEYSLHSILDDCRVNARYGHPFIITGGEPTIRPDICEIARAVKGIGPIAMLSNGVRIGTDQKMFDELIPILTDRDGLVRLNLSIHQKETDKWRDVLLKCRAAGVKIESLLLVIDSEEAFLDALVVVMEFRDVAQSFRIKAASRLWNEQKPTNKIFVSDMLRWLAATGDKPIIYAEGHNQTTFFNVRWRGVWLMLVSWYDVTNVDLREIDCPPFYRAKNGEVCNLVTWGLINEGLDNGWLGGKRVLVSKSGPLAFETIPSIAFGIPMPPPK